MKIELTRRITAGLLAFLLLLTALGLSACSSSSQEAEGMGMAFCSLYVDEDAAQEYGASLAGRIPGLEDVGGISVTVLRMGEVENDPEAGVFSDPTAGGAGMMKFTAMIAGGELDVVISDMENGARSARGGSFLALEELFGPEELEELQDRLLSFELVDYDGENTIPTGEFTGPCGIDLSGNAELSAVFGGQDVGVFVAANSERLDLAREIVLDLL